MHKMMMGLGCRSFESRMAAKTTQQADPEVPASVRWVVRSVVQELGGHVCGEVGGHIV